MANALTHLEVYGDTVSSKLGTSVHVTVIEKEVKVPEQAQIFRYLISLGKRICVFGKDFCF